MHNPIIFAEKLHHIMSRLIDNSFPDLIYIGKVSFIDCDRVVAMPSYLNTGRRSNKVNTELI